MKCPKCHFDNPEDSQFCMKCGTQIITPGEGPSPHTNTLHIPLMELTIGSTFAGRYQVVEELGRGGMGRVYKVFDKEIKETIALKLLNPIIASDEKMIERFRNELKLSRKISHKNICRMYHFGEEGGTYYITMEYVPGEDLKSLIRRIGQFTVGKAVSIAKQSYEGLAEAHKLGVIHRDLKPHNIMIDKEGNVRIMDFGIARFQESQGITDTGTMMGTPEYMSPEQVEGEEVDQRSDIYSSGVILYEMLTGGVPFEGNTPLSVAVKHKTELPREPREFNAQIPDALNQMILRCMEKKKDKRYQRTEEILSELTKIEKDIPTKEMILEGQKSAFKSFLRKLKERKILETLAAFIGGGWLVLEFIIHLLIHEYKFPPITRDIALGVIIISMICTVTWRWFRREEIKSRKVRLLSKIKFKWVAAFILIGIVFFGGYRLWKGLIQPDSNYEDFILLQVDIDDPEKVQKNLIEYLLLRSLEASTDSRILVQEDYTAYKRTTESKDIKPAKPFIAIYTDVYSNVTGFEGFDVSLEMNNKGKTFKQKFECKGHYDLISNKIEEMLLFMSNGSDGKIGKIEGDKTFSQICTGNWEALSHFLKGEEARKELDHDKAIPEYEDAINYDQGFSLAYLKLADISLFGGYREKATNSLQKALKRKNKLIGYDLLRCEALMARLNFNTSKEREYIMQLIEAFPLNKEYHYELAESYFSNAFADEAVKHYKKTLDLDPDFARAHNHIGMCYAWIGDHKKAEEHFKKYVDLDHSANSFDSLACGYMFAGKYDEGIKAANMGKELDSNLQWLYGNLARNFIQKGFLTKAIDKIKEQVAVIEKKEHITATDREESKLNAFFYSVFIEFLRGNLEKSAHELRPLREFFSNARYKIYVDDSSNLPFWFTGVLAFEQKDLSTLRDMTKWIEKKFANYKDKNKLEVNARNYHPIHKFYIHLKILEAYLTNDENETLRYIEEGKRIKEKLGYWTSMFNLSYFYDEYAKILIKLNRTNQALELLNEAIEYNPNYASSHINLAKIHLKNNNFEEAQKEYQSAQELLLNADKDFILVKEVEKIGEELLSISISD
ncbi:MAG: protein kinase [Candidatus Aminicenantes bacterium]|nr:protein kinase [Candidatus Aminicenantes bacterium]